MWSHASSKRAVIAFPGVDGPRELMRILEINHCGTRSFTSMRDAKAAVQRAVEGSEKDSNDRILECSR